VRRESVEKQVKSGLGTFLRKKNFLALKAINLQWALRFFEFGTLASAFSEAFLEAITRGGALRWQISQFGDL
jgi:hypothetical protein